MNTKLEIENLAAWVESLGGEVNREVLIESCMDLGARAWREYHPNGRLPRLFWLSIDAPEAAERAINALDIVAALAGVHVPPSIARALRSRWARFEPRPRIDRDKCQVCKGYAHDAAHKLAQGCPK